LRSVHTSNLPALLDRLHISLVVSTYQAGKVILIRNAHSTLNIHFHTFTKPMGITADASWLAIGGTNTGWYYRNMPAVAQGELCGRRASCESRGSPSDARAGGCGLRGSAGRRLKLMTSCPLGLAG
jgi:hypothetical protein